MEYKVIDKNGNVVECRYNQVYVMLKEQTFSLHAGEYINGHFVRGKKKALVVTKHYHHTLSGWYVNAIAIDNMENDKLVVVHTESGIFYIPKKSIISRCKRMSSKGEEQYILADSLLSPVTQEIDDLINNRVKSNYEEVGNPICEFCGLYKESNYCGVNSCTDKGPDRIMMILPFPEKEEIGKPFSGSRAGIVKALIGDNVDKITFSYAVRCCPEKLKLPENATRFCKKFLAKDLEEAGTSTIMTFGAAAFEALTEKEFGEFSYNAGKTLPIQIRDKAYTLIPNYDPLQMNYDDTICDKMEVIMEEIFGSKKIPIDPDKPRWAVYSPEEMIEELNKIVEHYENGDIDHFEFDIETSVSLLPWEGGKVLMFSIAHDMRYEGVSVPLVLNDAVVPENFPYEIPNIPFTVSEHDAMMVLKKLRQVLKIVPIEGHNLKYDLKWLHWHSICNLELPKIHMDTYNASHQIYGGEDAEERRAGKLSLKQVVRKNFAIEDDWEIEVKLFLSKLKGDDKHYGNIPTGLLAKYAALDTFYNKLLGNYYRTIMTEGQKRSLRQMDNLTQPVADSEIKGMLIDKEMLSFMDAEITKLISYKLERILSLKIPQKYIQDKLMPLVYAEKKKKNPRSYEEIKEEIFNLKSSVVRQELLHSDKYYQMKGLLDSILTPREKKKHQRKSKKSMEVSYAADKHVRAILLNVLQSESQFKDLEKKMPMRIDVYREAREFMEIYSEFSKLTKLKDSYINSLPKLMLGDIYHPEFNIGGTKTGRQSSAFHTLPRVSDVKRLIGSRWAESGGIILACDQSQLELRVAAALSMELFLIDSFVQGKDIHSASASRIFSIEIKDVTEEQRSIGKTFNFAILFGKGAEGLSSDLRVSVQVAQGYLDSFFANVPALRDWIQKQHEDIVTKAQVETPMGRIIPVPEGLSNKEYEISEAKRYSVNYMIQSTSSDIVSESSIGVWHRLRAEQLKSIFFASVHDSQEFDVFPGELFKVVKMLIEEGQTKLPNKFPWLICPLRLDFEIGTTWGGAVECAIEEVTDTSLIFNTSGLRKDIMSLMVRLKKAYKVDIDILDETVVDEKLFKEDVFFRDSIKYKAKFSIFSK